MNRRRRRIVRSRGVFARIVVLSLILCLLIVGGVYFWQPPKPDLAAARPADSVVALAGGPNRLQSSLNLVGEGVAPTLIVSNPSPETDDLAKSTCDGQGVPANVEVVCFDPSPATTEGEAVGVAGIARDLGLTDIIVVTNGSHSHRAGFIFRRCTDAHVRIYPVSGLRLESFFVQLAREIGGMVKFGVTGACS